MSAAWRNQRMAKITSGSKHRRNLAESIGVWRRMAKSGVGNENRSGAKYGIERRAA
jgi:hypothetical protein